MTILMTANAETLRDVVLERLHAIPEVHSTQTLFVLDEAELAVDIG